MDSSLTELQQKAIEATGKVILKSCPGSGKTHVVANKTVQQLKDWKDKNRGIAILSFTNVASDELKNRIDNISSFKIGYPHYIGTLDSFISQYVFLPFGHIVMNCKEKPSIIQDYSMNILQYSSQLWRKECYKSGCKPLDFYYDENGFLNNLRQDIGKCPVSNKKSCEKFKSYCYKHGYATYQDIIMIALRILKDNNDIAKLLVNRFPMLIIDEAQDTSAEQMKLIDVLIENGLNEVMLIGDTDQAIYEWRDADPSIFMEKYNNYLWDSRLLNENFRCSQHICDSTKVFSTLPHISLAVGESASDKFIPEVIKYDPGDKQRLINYFLETCKTHKIEISDDKVAVLVRGKSGLLGKDYSQIQDLWQNQFTKLLAEATFEKDTGSLNKAINLVEKALYSIYIKNKICNDINLKEIVSIIPEGIWKKVVLEFCKCMPSSDTNLKEWKVKITNLIQDITAKYQFKLIGDYEIKTKIRVNASSLKDFLEQPIKDFFAKTYKGDYLNATIHSVKGKTFDAVLLIIGTNGKLTSNLLNTYPVESEPIRTGYVAMTRARRILMVAIPKSIKDSTLVRFNNGFWNIVYDY